VKFHSLDGGTTVSHTKKIVLGTVATTAIWMLATTASAQTRSRVYGDQLTKQSQTFYLQGDVQATTYESEAAGSKETNETSSLKVGAWTGEGRIVGIEMASSDAVTKFSLNSNTINTSFKDVRLMTRLGWIHPSVGASLTELDVKTPDAQMVGIYATGVNAGLKIAIPVTLEMVVHAEGSIAHPTKTFDKLNQGTKLGDRTEADIGASYDLTETALDLLVGYKVRSFRIETDSRNFQENSSGAYAGLRIGLYF
jgi:hypothetical protein